MCMVAVFHKSMHPPRLWVSPKVLLCYETVNRMPPTCTGLVADLLSQCNQSLWDRESNTTISLSVSDFTVTIYIGWDSRRFPVHSFSLWVSSKEVWLPTLQSRIFGWLYKGTSAFSLKCGACPPKHSTEDLIGLTDKYDILKRGFKYSKVN